MAIDSFYDDYYSPLRVSDGGGDGSKVRLNDSRYISIYEQQSSSDNKSQILSSDLVETYMVTINILRQRSNSYVPYFVLIPEGTTSLREMRVDEVATMYENIKQTLSRSYMEDTSGREALRRFDGGIKKKFTRGGITSINLGVLTLDGKIIDTSDWVSYSGYGKAMSLELDEDKIEYKTEYSLVDSKYDAIKISLLKVTAIKMDSNKTSDNYPIVDEIEALYFIDAEEIDRKESLNVSSNDLSPAIDMIKAFILSAIIMSCISALLLALKNLFSN